MKIGCKYEWWVGECFFWYQLTRVVRTKGRKTVVVVVVVARPPDSRCPLCHPSRCHWIHVGHTFVSCTLYADDIALLSASCYRLQKLVNICKLYGINWICESSAAAEVGDHLVTIDMGRKVAGCCCSLFWGG